MSVRLLLDMNLSPQWVGEFAAAIVFGDRPQAGFSIDGCVWECGEADLGVTSDRQCGIAETCQRTFETILPMLGAASVVVRALRRDQWSRAPATSTFAMIARTS